MASSNVLQRLEARAATADQMIAFLKKEIADIKQFCSTRNDSAEAQRLEEENKKLGQEIEECKQKLIRLEISHGKKQVPLPSGVTPVTVPKVVASAPPPAAAAATTPAKQPPKEKKKPQQQPESAERVEPASAAAATAATQEGGQAGGGKTKKPKKPQPPKQPEKADDDITRLDLRVGLIVTAERHPDADSLYVEKVDVGGEAPLTVISGLAGRIPLEEMQNRPAIFLCNLKPAKMRGIISQAMVMCASDPGGKIEIIAPPSGSVPGDRVGVEGSDLAQPDTQLKPKVWEACAAKLRTRPDLVAAFDGKALCVPGKGLLTTASLVGVPIK